MLVGWGPGRPSFCVAEGRLLAVSSTGLSPSVCGTDSLPFLIRAPVLLDQDPTHITFFQFHLNHLLSGPITIYSHNGSESFHM